MRIEASAHYPMLEDFHSSPVGTCLLSCPFISHVLKLMMVLCLADAPRPPHCGEKLLAPAADLIVHVINGRPHDVAQHSRPQKLHSGGGRGEITREICAGENRSHVRESRLPNY